MSPPTEQRPPPSPEAPTPAPSSPSRPQPPLTRSRTIWGAILAALAGLVEFVRVSFSQVASAFPIVATPIGPFNTIYILAAVLVIGLGIVIYARIDDRRKGKR